jgi:myo-inositol-1-phosphate synthase
MAGVEAIRRGMAKPIGSLTQMGTIRLGKRTDGRSPLIHEFVPLAKLDDIVFGGWDLFPDDAFMAASKAGVLSKEHLTPLKDFLSSIKPMTPVFDQEYVKKLTATHQKTGKSKADLAEQVIEDIKRFKKDNNCDRLVMVWCGSTEVYRSPSPVHATLAAFEKGLQESDPEIRAVADLRVRGAQERRALRERRAQPDRRHAALMELAKKNSVPIGGKDFKTGQTLMKTILAPGLQGAPAGRRGLVLDEHPRQPRRRGARRSGVVQVEGGVEARLAGAHLPAAPLPRPLREDAPRGAHQLLPAARRQQEGWDNIDIFGWMGYPMQIKVDFLCRDSILAAPIVLDLALFMDLAQRCGMSGIQEWLSFYWKSPQTAPGLYPSTISSSS